MKMLLTMIVILAFPGALLAEESIKGRWYTASQLELGKQVYANNCMACHGTEGQGLVADWKQPQADGAYPPPPLNGTAHAWHHDMKTLLSTINRGGIPLGGSMPAFKDILTEEEKIAVLIYIQSLWPEELYQVWKDRNG